MANLVLTPTHVGKFVGSRSQSRPGHGRVIVRADNIQWFIRYTFYAFIFSLPFEELGLTLGSTLPKLFGLALAGLALLQPSICYKSRPKALWFFALYVVAFALSAAYLMVEPPQVPQFSSLAVSSLLRLVQLLVLFWIAYNLLRHEQIIRGTLWAFVASTLVLATLLLLGITRDVSTQGRVASTFQENPNGLATVLSLGLLALFGLAYGRGMDNWKARLLFWFGSGIIAIPIVQTGSRGAVVALAASLAVFFLRGRSPATKLKLGMIGLAGIALLAVASYQIEAVRVRWERTFYDESFAGRERIYPEAVGMILEKPLTGWGPVNHLWELGARLGLQTRDEHNVYLWVLAEVGILGALPFFVGLWLCLRAAWKARHNIQGILPLVMLLFILVSSMKGTLLNRKYFWVVLSYAMASASYIAARKSWAPVSASPHRVSGATPHAPAPRRRQPSPIGKRGAVAITQMSFRRRR
jgi:O-antigen ligase